MKLVVLGSGSSTPHAARSASGYWLETWPLWIVIGKPALQAAAKP